MSQQICTFHLADLFLGLDVLVVQEVLRASELARVPLAPVHVEGLLNLRGQIVTAIDLRRRLGLAARPAEVCPMFMIVRSGGGFVALIVDRVGDVIDVDRSSFEPPPDAVRGSVRGLLAGVHKLPGALVHVLDAAAIAAVPAQAA